MTDPVTLLRQAADVLEKPKPIYVGEFRDLFEGFAGRRCGEHRTCGTRAWCHDCSEWCYEVLPCERCGSAVPLADLAKPLAMVLRAIAATGDLSDHCGHVYNPCGCTNAPDPDQALHAAAVDLARSILREGQ